MREGIRRLLEPEADIELVAACEDLPSLLEAIEAEMPDVVLTDIRMPPSDQDEGIRAAAELRETSPETGVVVPSVRCQDHGQRSPTGVYWQALPLGCLDRPLHREPSLPLLRRRAEMAKSRDRGREVRRHGAAIPHRRRPCKEQDGGDLRRVQLRRSAPPPSCRDLPDVPSVREPDARNPALPGGVGEDSTGKGAPHAMGT